MFGQCPAQCLLGIYIYKGRKCKGKIAVLQQTGKGEWAHATVAVQGTYEAKSRLPVLIVCCGT